MIINTKNRKGFTLSELLIVVAIIGVLVAVAVPIFSSQLEKSREATDLANVRSAYAQIIAEAITDDSNEHSITVNLKQMQNGWQTSSAQATLEGLGTVKSLPEKSGVCAVSWDKNSQKVLFDFKGSMPVTFPAKGIDENIYNKNFAKAYGEYVKLVMPTDTMMQSRLDFSTANGITIVWPGDSHYSGVTTAAQKAGYPEEIVNGLKNGNLAAYFNSEGELLAVRCTVKKGLYNNVYFLQYSDGETYEHTNQNDDLRGIVAAHYGITTS